MKKLDKLSFWLLVLLLITGSIFRWPLWSRVITAVVAAAVLIRTAYLLTICLLRRRKED